MFDEFVPEPSEMINEKSYRNQAKLGLFSLAKAENSMKKNTSLAISNDKKDSFEKRKTSSQMLRVPIFSQSRVSNRKALSPLD